MIKEYEYLHGVVFNRLCNVTTIPINIRPFKPEGYSSYIINDSAGLFIKYSSKRLSPWRFTFQKSHQVEISEMQKRYSEVFIALVCNLDGVVVLNHSELKLILDDDHKDSEWMSVSRTRNKMYTVAASDGKLGFKISKTSCPDKIVSFLSLGNAAGMALVDESHDNLMLHSLAKGV